MEGECSVDEFFDFGISGIGGLDGKLFDVPTQVALEVAEAGDGDDLEPAAGVKIGCLFGAVDKTQVVMGAGEEGVRGYDGEDGAVSAEAGVAEDDGQNAWPRWRGGGSDRGVDVGRRRGGWAGENLREVFAGPSDRVGEIELGADRETERGESIGGDADDDGLVGAEREMERGGGVGLAGGGMAQVAGEYLYASGLDAVDGLGDIVEFGFMVTEVEDGGGAAGQGGVKGEVDGASRASGDDVTVFE